MRIAEAGVSLDGEIEDSVSITVSTADQAASPYFYVPLEIPADLPAVTVELDYQRRDDCIVDLGLFDPRASAYPTQDGFRGWSGGARSLICVTQDAATPGYVPGPLVPGRWLIALGLYKLPAEGAEVTLRVRASEDGLLATPEPEPAPFSARGPGWYRGDCHCHTYHSDAPGSPQLLHETARECGLDFLFVTDHNTISSWPAYFRAASGPELVFLPGMEVTTADGHANILGAERWVDFRLERDADIDVLGPAAWDAGGLLSLNHDKPPIPWKHKLPDIHCMELWHEEWRDGNDLLLARYDALLREGRRITAIGGSDYHQEADLRIDGERLLGRPTTVIYAARLDREGILAAFRNGRVYITEAPDGPHLDISVDGSRMGSRVPLSDGAVMTVVCRGAEGDRLAIIGDTGPMTELQIDEDSFSTMLSLPAGMRYIRAEILAGAGASDDDVPPRRRALSNPVYFADQDNA